MVAAGLAAAHLSIPAACPAARRRCTADLMMAHLLGIEHACQLVTNSLPPPCPVLPPPLTRLLPGAGWQCAALAAAAAAPLLCHASMALQPCS